MIPRHSGMTEAMTSPDVGVHLTRTADRVEEVDGLAERAGGRVGLSGVLDDLNRTAAVARVPGNAVTWGFRWNEEDQRSKRWWPQGISTSADADPSERVAGRSVVMTSAYSKKVRDFSKGSRISVVDVSDRTAVRYRHVLLVEPYVDRVGRVDVRPMHLHAGGIVWHGEHLHVAGTRRGVVTFRLDDIVRVGADQDPVRLGFDGDRLDGFGYRYLLPARFAYQAGTADGFEQYRYSFLSLDRSADGVGLVAGEYGRGSMTTRLVRYDIDPTTSLLRTDESGISRPLTVHESGVNHTQGAVLAAGHCYLSTSHGRFMLGSIWSGTPGRLQRHRFAMPVGPEDLTYWPSRDELWSLSEHPGHRYVFAMSRDQFD